MQKVGVFSAFTALTAYEAPCMTPLSLLERLSRRLKDMPRMSAVLLAKQSKGRSLLPSRSGTCMRVSGLQSRREDGGALPTCCRGP